MRSCRSGQVKNTVQTMLSTDIIVSATKVCHLPASSGLSSHAIHLRVSGSCNSASLSIEHPGAYMGDYSQVRLEVSCLWRV